MGNYAGFRIQVSNFSDANMTMTSIGDVNGDGIDDIAVGRPDARVGFEVERVGIDNVTYTYERTYSSGAVYVLFGKPTGDAEISVDLDNLAPEDGFVITPEGALIDSGRQFELFDNFYASRADFGVSVTGLGDVNGDGIDDFAIGQAATAAGGVPYFYGDFIGYGNNQSENGVAYVIYGGQTVTGSSVSVADLDGFRIDVAGALDDVVALGDVNGDGINDVGVNATDFDADGTTDLQIDVTATRYQGVYDPDTQSFVYENVQVTNSRTVSMLLGETKGYVIFGTADDRVSDTPLVNGADGPLGTPSTATVVVNAEELDGSDGFSVVTGRVANFAGYNYGYYGYYGPINLNTIDGISVNSVETSQYYYNPVSVLRNGFFDFDSGGKLIAVGDINGDGIDDIVIDESDYSGFNTANAFISVDESNPNFFSVGNSFGVFNNNDYIVIYGQTAATAAALDVDVPSSDFDYFISGSFYRTQTVSAGLGDVSGNDGNDEVGIHGFLNSIGPLTNDVFGTDSVYGFFVVNGTGDAPLTQNGTDPANRTLIAQELLDGQGAFYYAGGTVTDLDTAYGIFVDGFAAVGDMNGDGLDDFVVLGYRYTNGTPDDEGYSAFLVLGTEEARTGAVDLDALVSGGMAYEFRTLETNFRLFSSETLVSSAGDFNGDGINDVVLFASNRYSQYQSDAQTKGIVIYGGTAALEALDNADGTDDNIGFVENVDVDVVTGLRAIELNLTGSSIFGTRVNEGTGADNVITLTVSRTGDLNAAVTVDYALTVLDGDVNAADFVGGALPSGTVSFAAGASTATIDIVVNGDAVIEGTERFSIDLSNPTTDNAAPIFIVDGTENITLFNDDFPVRFSSFATSVFEGQPGDANELIYVVNRFGNTAVEATVDYSIAGSTRFGSSLAADSDDVVGNLPLTGTLTFAPGVTRLEIAVPISGDLDIEETEYLGLTLSNAQAGGVETILPNGAVTGAIIADDFNPRLSILVNGSPFGGSVSEGNTGLTPVTVTFLREGSTEGTLDLTYALTQGVWAGSVRAADSADIEGDLPSTGNTVRFEDGQASVDVVVNIVGDRTIEANEFFEVQLTSFTSSADIDYELFVPRAQITIRNDDGRPAVPVLPFDVNGDGVIEEGETITVESDVFGDPHITTLDGLGYSFQAVGEYILVERTAASGDHDAFAVQVRFEPVEGSDLVSITTRVAVTIDGNVIEIDAKTGTALINGVAATEEQLLTGSAGIFGNDDGSWSIILNGDTGEQLMVGNFNGALNVCVFLASTDNIQGLMGNANGDLSDDYGLRDGSPAEPSEVTFDANGVPSLSFDYLYGRGIWLNEGYAQSWEVRSDERMFSDAVPSLPDNFPLANVTLNDLPSDVVDAAIAAALASGLDPNDNQTIFNNAVLDFALTGDEAFFQSAQMLVAQPEEASVPTGAPLLGTIVGVSAAETQVVEGNSGTTAVTFTIYRIGDLLNTSTVNYALTGTANAADLELGTPLSGSVTFESGETTKIVTVNVQGDTLTEANETLTMRISAGDESGMLIGAVTATTTIVTDDFNPVAVDDVFSTSEDTAVLGNLLSANIDTEDSDANGDVLSVVAVNGGALGAGPITLASGATLTVDANGLFGYDPTTAFNALAGGEIATDSFTYTISDGNGGSDTATATFTIQGVNDAPEAEDDFFETASGTQITFSVVDLVANDTDAENDVLTVVQLTSQQLNGGISFDEVNGTITYIPDAGFAGDDSFEVVVSDGNGGTATSTVTVTVLEPVNTAPIAVNDAYNVRANSVLTVLPELGLLSNDADPEGDDLSVTSIESAANGELLFNASGAFTYTPDAGFVGTEVLIYTITDGELFSTATVTINVTNEGPTALADTFRIDAEPGLRLLDVLANDSDADFDQLTVVSVTQPASGEVTLNDGVVSFDLGTAFATLPVGETAEVSFEYTITDGIAQSTASVTITIDGTFVVVDPVNVVEGTTGRDILTGTTGDDLFLFKGGFGDVARGAGGADTFDFSDNLSNGVRDNARIMDWSSDDVIIGFDLGDIHLETVRSSSTALRFAYGEDNDILTITGNVPTDLADLFALDHTLQIL